MNKIYVDVKFKDGIVNIDGINLITGDYNSTEMEFEFDYSSGYNVINMINPDNEVVLLSKIENKKIILENIQNNVHYSIFNKPGVYYFELIHYENDSKLTSVKSSIKVDKNISTDEASLKYLPIFDEMTQELNKLINETNQLNIDLNKTNDKTIITLTDKNGNKKSVVVLDGEVYDDTEIKNDIEDLIIEVNSLDNNKLNKDKYATGSEAGVIVLGTGFELNEENKLECLSYNSTQYESKNIHTPISKGTLENVLTGKGFVADTDYATKDKGGTVKTSNTYHTGINSGILLCQEMSSQEYENANRFSFISKGTLENILNKVMYYNKGDVINIENEIATRGIICSGYMTGGRTKLIIQIPLPKIIKNDVTNINIDCLTAIRCDGVYLISAGSRLNNTNYNIETKSNESGIQMIIQKTDGSTFNAGFNNYNITAILYGGTITFS